MTEQDCQHVEKVAFSPDESVVAVGAVKFLPGFEVEHVLTLWDAATGRHLRTFRGADVRSDGWGFSSDGRLLAIPATGRTGVDLRSVADGKVVRRFDHPFADTAALSPDGKYLVTRLYVNAFRMDPALCVWDVGTGKKVFSTPRAELSFPWAFFAPDGRLVFVTEIDRVRTWNPATGGEDPPVPIVPEPTDFLYPSPDGGRFMTVPDGRPSLHDRTGKVVRAYGRAGDGYTYAKPSPDGSMVMAGTKSGGVTLWEAATGIERARFNVPDMASQFGPYVRFTPDGRYLIVSWSQPIPGETHTSPAAAVYSPDGRLVRRDANVWHVEFGPAGASVVVVRRTLNAAGGVNGFDVTVHDAAAWLAGAVKKD